MTKMLTVNWTVPVSFECHFTRKEARIALNEARQNGRVSPGDWDLAVKLLDDLFAGRSARRLGIVFLMDVIGADTGLLPSIDSDNPHLHRKQTGLDQVTDIAVTEPV